MSSINDLKELVKGHEKKHIKRREKEKEGDGVKRTEEKEEVKDMLKNH